MTSAAEAVKFELVEGIGPAPKRKHRNRRATRARREKENRAKIRNAAKVRAWITQYKLEHPCSCGERNPACLDFHHVGETKNRVVSDAKTMTQALKELPFCIVVCANCHRKLHAREGSKEYQPRLAI